jgi:hypothetical protein
MNIRKCDLLVIVLGYLRKPMKKSGHLVRFHPARHRLGHYLKRRGSRL